MKTIRLVFLLFAIFLLAACGGGEAADSAAADSAEPADSAEAADSSDDASAAESDGGGAAASGPSSLNLDDMSQFAEIPGDYHMELAFNFQGQDESGSAIDSTLSIQGDFQEEPIGSRVDMMVSGFGDLGDTEQVTYTELDDTLYFYAEPAGCAVLPAQDDTLYNDFVDTGGLLRGEVQRVQPDEVVNGIDSYVYAITADNLDPEDETGSEIGELTGGALYVAKDGGYVTRLVLEGRGVNEVLTSSETLEGDIHYQLDFTPAPDGVSIVIPEGCQSLTSEDAAYPVMDDASGVSAFSGFYQYTTNYEFDTVINFYKDELSALGWELKDDTVYGDTAILGFTMGEEGLGVLIARDPNSNAITVNISEQ